MMKKYDIYKKSKLQWVNEIPSHWIESKVKYLFEIGRGRVISKQELNPNGKYPVFSSQTKNNGCLGYIDTFDFDDNILTWTTDGANAGEVFKRNGKFNCTNVCGTLKPKKELNLDYFLFLMKHLTQFYKRPDTNGAKIMNGEMAEIISFLPSLNEQNIIASYLNKKNNNINLVISENKKLIKKLREQKQAIIKQAVTKGLDANIPLKSSVIDWVDEVPENWKEIKIRYIFEIIKNISGELGYDVLSVTQKGLKVKDITNHKGQFSMDYSKYQIVEKGDFVMNHMDLLTGYIDISKQLGVTSPDYRVFRSLNNDIIPDFFLYLFQMAYKQRIFYSYGQGVSQLGRWRLPATAFKNMVIPIPDRSEQIQIVNFLNHKVGLIQGSIKEIEKIIEKLVEYRQSLISEAVTGKIDLRGWQPQEA